MFLIANIFQFQRSSSSAVAVVQTVSHRPGKVIPYTTYNFLKMHGRLKIKLVLLRLTFVL